MRELELLSPAKNLECGKAAIDCGADAVYIGAERFGARQSVGNSIADIAELCTYAHQFNAKVYVTVNTIIYDNELDATLQLIGQLTDVGVDAILVQDMGLLRMPLPDITLHASTQTDNRTVDKVKWLSALGFKRVVLARELSLSEIEEIHKELPDTELEVFVHGALCVSYSGICYASENCFQRSANRGTCAQFCRLKFDLLGADGNVIEAGAHFLSLKDMCRIDSLERLADAGVTSFKIEGRLKDISYVKNVTAAFCQKLDEIISSRRGEYRRASRGICRHTFTPNLKKTFNRGFTEYFLDGRKSGMASFYTPKAMGEYVGKVKEIRGNSFNVAGTANFSNGDGLCFINSDKQLEGFRINRAEGNRLFPLRMPVGLRRGTALYRNNDQAFEKDIAADDNHRRLLLHFTLSAADSLLQLEARIFGTDIRVRVSRSIELQQARKSPLENIKNQLAKVGNTIFSVAKIEFAPSAFNYFIPNSFLSDLRRECLDSLQEKLLSVNGKAEKSLASVSRCKYDAVEIDSPTNMNENTGEGEKKGCSIPLNQYVYGYMYNIANEKSKEFYTAQGLRGIQPAFELHKPQNPLIMQCRYCLRYEIGQCKKRTPVDRLLPDPMRLRLGDGRTFRLEFDCSKCQMNIYAE